MNWPAIAFLELFIIAIMGLVCRHLYGDYKKVVFVNSRGYRVKNIRGYESPHWQWQLPKGEQHRLMNQGQSPKGLTLEEAYRRAKLEEERERLQLPEQKSAEVVVFHSKTGLWQ